ADRLLHEGGARPPEFALVEHHGRRYLDDPVSGNDWMMRAATPVPSSSPIVFAERPPPSTFAPPRAPDPASARLLAERLVEGGEPWLAVTELRRAAFLAADRGAASDLLAEGGWIATRTGALWERDRYLPGGPFDEAERLFDLAAEKDRDPARAARAGFGRAFPPDPPGD